MRGSRLKEDCCCTTPTWTTYRHTSILAIFTHTANLLVSFVEKTGPDLLTWATLRSCKNKQKHVPRGACRTLLSRLSSPSTRVRADLAPRSTLLAPLARPRGRLTPLAWDNQALRCVLRSHLSRAFDRLYTLFTCLFYPFSLPLPSNLPP